MRLRLWGSRDLQYPMCTHAVWFLEAALCGLQGKGCVCCKTEQNQWSLQRCKQILVWASDPIIDVQTLRGNRHLARHQFLQIWSVWGRNNFSLNWGWDNKLCKSAAGIPHIAVRFKRIDPNWNCHPQWYSNSCCHPHWYPTVPQDPSVHCLYHESFVWKLWGC